MPRRANRLDVNRVEADAVLADDLELRHLRQDFIVDTLEADDGAVVAAEERDELGAADHLWRFGERHLRVFRRQLGAERRVSRERSRRDRDLRHDAER